MEPKQRIPFPENTELIVGKYYNVTCAIMNYADNTKTYIPVIGMPHSDPQFGAARKHYHIDGRFYREQHADGKGQTNHPVWVEGLNSECFAGITVLRKQCKRLTTGLKLYSPGNPYKDWYDTMIGKSCAGRKCPHRGTYMLERDGRLLCPLHNLQGDIKTEVIIERVELEWPELGEHIRLMKEALNK